MTWLSTGRRVGLRRARVPFVRDYFVLDVDLSIGPPTPDEIGELLAVAHGAARELAARLRGDPDAFSLLYNGGRARRRPWPHVHLVLAADPAEKRRAYVALSLKRLTRWRRWLRPSPRGPEPTGVGAEPASRSKIAEDSGGHGACETSFPCRPSSRPTSSTPSSAAPRPRRA